MPIAEIITIGTELLLGETADTNTRFIALSLRSLGIDIYRAQTIGDNAVRITQTVREALTRAEIVITTGGLGPTVDDPTRQALAEAVGRELEYHPELWEQIKKRISRYGRIPTENQKRQAYIPKGAAIIKNPVGTAPAFIIETAGGVVICLPGVPSEMETLLTDSVIPYLQDRFSLHGIILVRSLHTSGVGEGFLDDKIGDLETLSNPTVGLCAHSGLVDIRISAKAGCEAEAREMIKSVENDLRSRLGNDLFGADEDTLEGVSLLALSRHGWSLACVENGLGGILLKRFVQAQNPAYHGGTIHTGQEESLVQAMNLCRQEFNADVCLGVSLRSVNEQQEILLLIITPKGKLEKKLSYGGHPKIAAPWAVNTALDWLRRNVQGTV